MTRDIIAIAKQDYFKDRVRFYATKAAIAVMSEAGNVVGHAERVIYAKAILAGSVDIQQLAYGVVTNSTIAASADAGTPPDFEIVDGDIEFVVNSLFNAYAGVSA